MMIILFESLIRGSGKTICAKYVAEYLSEKGYKVCFVDGSCLKETLKLSKISSGRIDLKRHYDVIDLYDYMDSYNKQHDHIVIDGTYINEIETISFNISKQNIDNINADSIEIQSSFENEKKIIKLFVDLIAIPVVSEKEILNSELLNNFVETIKSVNDKVCIKYFINKSSPNIEFEFDEKKLNRFDFFETEVKERESYAKLSNIGEFIMPDDFINLSKEILMYQNQEEHIKRHLEESQLKAIKVNKSSSENYSDDQINQREIWGDKVFCLKSKDLYDEFGFDCGDIFYEIVEQCSNENHHKVLVKVVKAYLIPILDKNIEISEPDTGDNPIMAIKSNSVDLFPSEIKITGKEVLKFC